MREKSSMHSSKAAAPNCLLPAGGGLGRPSWQLRQLGTVGTKSVNISREMSFLQLCRCTHNSLSRNTDSAHTPTLIHTHRPTETYTLTQTRRNTCRHLYTTACQHGTRTHFCYMDTPQKPSMPTRLEVNATVLFPDFSVTRRCSPAEPTRGIGPGGGSKSQQNLMETFLGRGVFYILLKPEMVTA